MAMAKDELQKSEGLVKMLIDSKTVRMTNCRLHVLYLKYEPKYLDTHSQERISIYGPAPEMRRVLTCRLLR